MLIFWYITHFYYYICEGKAFKNENCGIREWEEDRIAITSRKGEKEKREETRLGKQNCPFLCTHCSKSATVLVHSDLGRLKM
jgi:hypothetical protein